MPFREKPDGMICRKCGKFKATRFFYKGRKCCKECESKQHKEIHSRPHPIANIKKCALCKRLMPSSMFAKDPTQTDGLHSHCKECQRESRKFNRTSKMINNPKSRKRLIS